MTIWEEREVRLFKFLTIKYRKAIRIELRGLLR
jgi:hypothetical protein